MNILICGCEGSLMQATIPRLLEMGHTIRGVDSLFRYGKVERKRNYEFIEGDLYDSALADKSSKGCDLIFQAAARIFGVGGFHKYPADILSKDVALHQNVLWSAVRNNVEKVVYISSSMVYERAIRVPSVESDVDDMPVPLTDYGLSKLVGERLSKAFYKQYSLKYTIWRPFNIITPFEKGENEPGMSHVFADFIRKLILEPQNPMGILGDGKQVRCFTWIEDVASAIAALSFDVRSDCDAFNLGNPEPITMIDLAKRIYSIAQEKGAIKNKKKLRFESFPALENDVRVRIPSIEKASKVLGWQPKVKLNEALDECVNVAINTASKINI